MTDSQIYEDFLEFLKRHNLKNVICFNSDNGDMGIQQAFKFVGADDDKYLVLAFSSSNETICPCCAKKERENELL